MQAPSNRGAKLLLAPHGVEERELGQEEAATMLPLRWEEVAMQASGRRGARPLLTPSGLEETRGGKEEGGPAQSVGGARQKG